MSTEGWSYTFVGLSFAVYIGIAIWSRVRSTAGFYVAGRGVPALANGMATAADWMSAASFISMAGLVSFLGYAGGVLPDGVDGRLRVARPACSHRTCAAVGHFTVPDFVGDRYRIGCRARRLRCCVRAIRVASRTSPGQMRGVGIVFSRFLGVDIDVGVV